MFSINFFRKTIFLVFCLSSFNILYAETPESPEPAKPATEQIEKTRFPMGCRDMGFRFENNQLILHQIPEGLVQTVYLMHNRAPFSVTLWVDPPSRFYPDYEKTIKPDAWVAFARDLSEVIFHCKAKESQADETIDCSEAIEICNYNNAKFPDSNFGTYWITNSKNQSDTINSVIKKGVLLRW
jgi:hypothetical protein